MLLELFHSKTVPGKKLNLYRSQCKNRCSMLCYGKCLAAVIFDTTKALTVWSSYLHIIQYTVVFIQYMLASGNIAICDPA